MALSPQKTKDKQRYGSRIDLQEAVKVMDERYAHYDLYVRHPYFLPDVKNVFRIRKSLAEHIKEKLLFAPGVYYQRVYMFAKKARQCSREGGTDNEKVLEESEEQSESDVYSTDSEVFCNYEEEDFENSDELSLQRAHRIKVKTPGKTDKQTAFIDKKLINLIADSETKVTGLFMSLGEAYAMYMFEGSEDAVGNFLKNLEQISSEIWCECRIFHVEDLICHTFFDNLVTVQYPAIHAHEKFLPSMSNDKDFMARQHFELKSRLNKLCEILSPRTTQHDNTIVDSSQMSEDSRRKSTLDQIKIYLPEVERIELILKCESFYHSFMQFNRIYGIIPHQKDEDAFAWPLPSDYTPIGIFRRNEFDVNLTFGDYLLQDTAVEQRGSSDTNTSEY